MVKLSIITSPSSPTATTTCISSESSGFHSVYPSDDISSSMGTSLFLSVSIVNLSLVISWYSIPVHTEIERRFHLSSVLATQSCSLPTLKLVAKTLLSLDVCKSVSRRCHHCYAHACTYLLSQTSHEQQSSLWSTNAIY
jgi:hypothetical protein